MNESRRRILLVGGLWALVTVATAAATPGCYGHNCDGSGVEFGGDPGEGRMLDANTWESSPIDGAWLPFPRQRAYYFNLSLAGGGRTPMTPLAFISAQENPSAENGNFTLGAGNLAEILYSPINGILTVHNGTCADYYLRVEVSFPDNGSKIDAGITDANDAEGD